MLVALGLGNPGREYEGSRHNLGKDTVIDLAQRLDLNFAEGKGEFYICQDPKLNLWLAVSATYMNLSGKSAVELVDSLGIEPEALLVVCDDFNLPLGSIRLRKSGGDGGHKGLGSIIYQLGTESFPRLRLGIGPLPKDIQAEEFVLSHFDQGEIEKVAQVKRRAGEAIVSIATRGIEKTMTDFNRRAEE